MSRLQGLAPVLDANTRVLVLGSFPGVASLRAQQYYGHPQNHFWRILGALWAQPLLAMDYAQRVASLREHGLGVWDVYGTCEREGSLDANIQHAELNDVAAVLRACPRLEAIAHNGGESYRHARHTERLGVPVYKLPSTSPANASWSFDRKLSAWAEVLRRHGVAA
ncbi:DNA-deoxyinosine glycosylase [Hydrogenophaga sp. PBL-H3]|uniref:DNA-deoxyinosine glycosylase n=1 Tax=Hydrogenophaga sp. PBL-H3 TaxID=434010 RepID=UPI00131F5FAF|nr:DNA-deoxyinosine glycosylase [Hydrogenophaga sp. PBL-H3]QHE75363.1 DNA-deoxyinosine glycosylase [Hydrogenophaga sp. PBL-H3]QHE79790.1 DNA-deoxyinosine glycosylase [Hydrogenophaga sp. PBL-H3]